MQVCAQSGTSVMTCFTGTITASQASGPAATISPASAPAVSGCATFTVTPSAAGNVVLNASSVIGSASSGTIVVNPTASSGLNICNAIAMSFSTYPSGNNTITCLTATNSNTTGAADPTIPAPSCGGPTAKSRWYKFTTPACYVGGNITAFTMKLSSDNTQTNFDTRLSIWETCDNTCNSAISQTLCINDKLVQGCSGSSPNPLAAGGLVTGMLQADRTYYLRIDGDNNATGTFQIDLTVEPQAPTLTTGTDPYTQINSNWPNVNPQAGYTLYWRKTGTTGVSSTSLTVNSNMISTLTPNTSYDVWVLNRCKASQTFYSPVSTFSTQNLVGCSTPVISCGAATNTTLQFTWPQITGALNYTLYYKKVGASGYSVASNIPYTTSGGISSFTFGGLTPGTQYQIWIYVYCSSSYSLQSNVITCTTTGPVAAPRPLGADIYSFHYNGIDYTDVKLEEQFIPVELPFGYNGADIIIADGNMIVKPVQIDYSQTAQAVSPALYINLEPNITDKESSLVIVSGEDKDAAVTVINMNGQIVHQASVALTQGTAIHKLDTSELSQGMYIVTVKTDMGMQTRKLIVTR
jgi:hypothetical protein